MTKSLNGVGDNITDAGTDMTGAGSDLTSAGSDLTSAAGTLVGKYASTGNQADLGGAAGDIVKASTALQTLTSNQEFMASLDEEQRNTLTAALATAASANNDALTKVTSATKDVSSAGSNVKSAGSKIEAGGSELKKAGATLKAYSGVDSAQLVSQLKALKAGIGQIASDDAQAALTGSNTAINSLLSGMQTVQTALNMTQAEDGSSGLVEGMATIDTGLSTLQKTGTIPLQTGVTTLINKGTSKLVTNNNILLTGMAQLSTGAGQISDGSSKLADGSKTLGEGITDLTDGTKELSTALADGAQEIRDNDASDDTLTMFSEPVDTKETSITTVKNNGHAMAAYMMSVGLWVGALAFCLMYPLTEYHGNLKNGLAWWASKAVIIYPLAVAMAGLLIAIMHYALGFDPESMSLTFATAAVAALAFMSIMYFFNALLGKVGSFLMLVFMVLQLAGSAGTYPVEISGPLVPILHKYVPFTYSVEAFRSAISGGTSIRGYLTVLIVLAVIFTVLTIGLFEYRAKRIKAGKPIIYTWIEEHGLA
jgi:putative membrane protein